MYEIYEYDICSCSMLMLNAHAWNSDMRIYGFLYMYVL